MIQSRIPKLTAEEWDELARTLDPAALEEARQRFAIRLSQMTEREFRELACRPCYPRRLRPPDVPPFEPLYAGRRL